MGSILRNCSLIFVQESITYHISFLCNQNGIAIKSECHMCKFYLVVSRTGGLLYSTLSIIFGALFLIFLIPCVLILNIRGFPRFKQCKEIWTCFTFVIREQCKCIPL